MNEIVLQNNFLEGRVVETIYFGGGTPSLLSAQELSMILYTIKKNFVVAENAEITLEANPDDVTSERLISWKELDVNRLSIGVQSFFEADLRWMNRVHSAIQAEECIIQAQKCGFDNLTIDLIYGTPTLSDENWHANVQKAVLLNIPHLSCYALTVEPKTPLETMINRRTTERIDAAAQARQFLLLSEWLTSAGYEQYEISNYSLPGKHSKHNSSYWQGKPYLGLGPSAHSFNGNTRQWNVSNNALYIQSLQKNMVPYEAEALTPTQQLNERIMTSLRTKEGLPLNHHDTLFNEQAITLLKRKSLSYQEKYLLKEETNRLLLTDEGKLFADGIAAALFFEEGEVY